MQFRFRCYRTPYPHAAVRIQHKLDDIGDFEEPAKRGSELPAQGLSEASGLLVSG